MAQTGVVPKFWQPIQEVYDLLVNFCKKYDYQNILEVGPGLIQFPLATKFVGYNEKIDNYITCDIDREKLPFQDKEFEFIYSRHVLEDIQNPDFALEEFIRCSKSGYVETPSPLIEMTKGVDPDFSNTSFAGYMHHRYIIWSNIEKGEIYFLPKYSCILDHFVICSDLSAFIKNPYYWNNYFIWKEGTTPKIILYKNGINMGFNGNLKNDYIEILNRAVKESIENTNYFLNSNF
jgi:hypothetical protein